MADNTASNLGTGQGIFSGKVADDLQFKSLKAGTNVTLSSDANEITINSTGTVTSGLNLGSGEGLYTSVATGALQLKSLIGGAGIALSNTGTEITIAADSANLNAGTLGGLASSAFLTKTDNLASVADIPTSRTNLGVYSKTEADNKFQIKAGNIMPDADNTRSIGDNSNRYSDVYATELHGTATRAGVVTSIGTHDIGALQNVDETGKAAGHVLKYNGSMWVSTVDGGATNIGALTDVDTSGIANGQVLKFNSSTSKFEPADDDSSGGGGSASFVGLTDTPANYTGGANKFVKVNAGGNSLEFVADPGYITDLSSFSTTNLAEGTNLYYTNARADARIGAASINALSDVDTSGAAAGKILKYNGTTWVIADESSLADTDALSEGSTNLYFTNARADARISAASINALTDVNTSGITSGQVLSWNGTSFVASSAGTGDITRVNITAGTGLTGTQDTTSGDHTQTLAVDVGTTAGKIIQLDGTGKLPAVDGSQLTGVSTTTSFVGLTDTPANFTGGANKLVRVNAAGNALEFIANNIPADTDGLSEGSTNQYFTNARAVSALNWGNLNYKTGTSGPTKIHLGKNANETGETGGSTVPDTAILIGEDAGRGHYNTSTSAWDDWAGDKSIAIGHKAGRYNLGQNTIAIGYEAGFGNDAEAGVSGDTLGTDAVAIGYQSQRGGGGDQSVAIGSGSKAETYTVAIGYQAGSQQDDTTNNPGSSSVFVGYKSGTLLTGGSPDNAGGYAVAIGFETLGAGANAPKSGNRGVFLGYRAGKTLGEDSGSNSIAIGYHAADNVGAGIKGFTVLNTSNASFNPTQSNAFYVTDIRNTTGTTFLQYNATSKEITHVAVDTDSIAEGSTNLYFTNARADARIAAASINALSDVDTTGIANDKILKYNSSTSKWEMADDQTGGGGSATFVGLSDTPGNFSGASSRFVKVNAGGNALEFVADPGYLTSVPAQSFASLTGKPTTIAGYGITDAFDGAFSSLSGKPTTIAGYGITDAFDNSAFDTRLATKDTGDVAEGSNLYFTDARARGSVSVTTGAASGGGTLSYNNGTGAFTFAPADLSGYQTTAGLNAAIDSHLNQSNPTSGYVLSWNGSDYAWVTNAGYTNTDFDNRLATKTTDNLSEGSTNLYYTDARSYTAFDTRLATKSTTNLSEGTNLYYTNARADARVNLQTGANLDLSSKDTDALSEGSTNLYFTNARSRSAISLGSAGSQAYNSGTGVLTVPGTTDHITEGSNLFYTDARADARVQAVIIDEDNMASDDNTKVPTQQSVKAYVDSQVASENELSEMNDVAIASVQNNDFLKYNTSTAKWENASVTAATAAGSDTQVQFNDGGVMGADAGFTYNKSTDAITVGSVTTTGASPQISAAGGLTIETTASNGNITITPHNTGEIILDGQKWPQADGSANQYLKTDGAGQLSYDSLTTDDVSEGANQYYTDARARAAISEGSAQLSYNSSTGVMTFTQDDTDGISEGSTNLYYTDARANSAFDTRLATKDTDDLSEGSTNQYFTNARAVSAVQGVNLDMGSNNITTLGKIYFKNLFSAEADLPSASTYHGMFAHVHATGAAYFAHGGAWVKLANNSQLANSANWDTSYGWGDHGAAGYLTSVPAQSFASLTGKPTTIAGYGITDAFDNSDFDTRLATKDTGDVAEGSNLYYTNARADARIAAAGLTTLSDVDAVVAGDDGKVLYYDHSSTSFKWKTDATGGGTLNTAGNTGTGSVTLASETLQVLGTTGQIVVDAAGFALSLSLDQNINSIQSIAFEGSTADTNEIKLTVTDPTADRTITMPDATGYLPVFTTSSPAAITDGTSGQALVTDGNGQLSFTTISSGSSLTVQDEGSSLSTAATTLNFVGAGVVASGTGATKTITIAGGGGSSGTTYEEFKINYSTAGQVQTISDTSSGISSVNIDSAAGGDLTVNFTGYSTPPLSFTMYGYNYAANKYNYNSAASGNMTLRELPGGGSSGSPTAFGSFSNMQIRCSESETGASRSFGTVTHAWVRFVMAV